MFASDGALLRFVSTVTRRAESLQKSMANKASAFCFDTSWDDKSYYPN